ncbi:MAG: peptidylprolyl isomerase [Acidobacteria bacterium]|nr:peptidylprolyl isomerase [Acidobacteriota bacterium]MBK7597630.1 peptidylprolyl isomerase [Acidobacteriota bacterium]MBK9706231.1 peptidylprolyl isomerase [Acidobacteriota bacterium]
MAIVKSGDTVKVHYTGKFDSGDIFDTSEGSDPLSFTVGAGEVIPGFDLALVGMTIGDSKEIVIPAEQGYGARIEELVQTIARDQFQLSGIDPEVGMAIEMQTPQGSIPLVITELTETFVTLDANHPLAGESLHFALTLVEISE